MRDLVYLPIGLIKVSDAEYWERSLAYFVKLKSLYRNNTHYNFSLRSLGEKIKCSPACLSHHLKILEQKGLIKFHSKNITFIGLKKLSGIYGINNIAVPVDFKNQLDLLRAQIIRFNLTAQTHRIKKSGIQQRKKGFVPLTRFEKMNSSYVGLSAKGIGNLFGLSQASGSRIRKKLSDMGLISVNRMYSVLLKGIDKRDFNQLRNGFDIPYYSFIRDGKVLIERRPLMEYNIGIRK